jgi:pyrimidine deaminase RibD-like protein
MVAKRQLAAEQARQSLGDAYLCTGFDVYITEEPCPMYGCGWRHAPAVRSISGVGLAVIAVAMVMDECARLKAGAQMRLRDVGGGV